MTCKGTSRAPGKALLMGEYTVLHGGMALVAAVDRFASVRPLTGGQREDARVAFVRLALARGLGWEAGPPLLVESSAFYCRGAKLGLGSSSALVAAVAAELARRNHEDPLQPGVRRRMWPVAKNVHDRLQGFSGSGVDVAACLFGGLLLVRPSRNWLRPFTLVPGMEVVFCWTGRSRATGEMVEAVNGWGRRNPTALQEHLRHMDGLMEMAAQPELEAGRLVELVAAYAEAMRALGEASQAPIVTPQLRELAKVARDLGGAAKPSGAGGGDTLVAVFVRPGAAESFRAECSARGALPLDLAFDFQGAGPVGQTEEAEKT